MYTWDVSALDIPVPLIKWIIVVPSTNVILDSLYTRVVFALEISVSLMKWICVLPQNSCGIIDFKE